MRGIALPLLFALTLTSFAPTIAAAQDEGTVVQAESTADDAQLSNRRRSRQVEEIVVRARKRDEFIEDTPISITAVGQQTLRDAGLTQLDQVQDLVPNLTFNTGRSGADPRIRVRGVGPLEGGDPGVGVYLDGVYLPRALGSVLNVVDIQQLEVLRGPQGTLFGKNTVGGAMNITTVKPHEELEAQVNLRFASYETFETRTTLNIPLDFGPFEDKLFSRWSIATVNSDGFTTNTLRNENWSNREALWVLGSLRFLPTEDLEINISGNYFQDHSRGKGGQCFAELDRPPNNIVAVTVVDPSYPGIFDDCRRSRPFRFEAEAHSITNPQEYGMWGNATYDMGEVGPLDSLQFKLLGSWREQTVRLREDVDQTGQNFVLVSGIGGGTPAGEILEQLRRGEITGGSERFAGRPRESRAFNVEGQVNMSALEGDFVAVMGVFAQWERRGSGLATRGSEESLVATQNGSVTVEATDQRDWDWAIFGQATYDAFDWLSLTGGIRYTEEKKGVNRLTINPFVDASVNPDAPIYLQGEQNVIFTAWTPMASVQLTAPDWMLDETPVEHFMGYFTYARGFKGGGFNAAVSTSRDPSQSDISLRPYQPEFLDNFEIGFKTIAWDGRFTLNAAFFHGNYTDIQVFVTTALQADPNTLPIVERSPINAAKATLRGFEIESQLRPWEDLMVTASLGVLDPTYDEFIGISDIDGSQLDRKGQSFNDVPKFSSFLSMQYPIPIDGFGPTWMDGYLTPRIEWSYQSKTHVNVGPELVGGRQRGFNLFNFRLSYDFYDDRGQIAFFIRNLTDEAYFRDVTTTVNPFGMLTRYFEPPRTFGGEIRMRF